MILPLYAAMTAQEQRMAPILPDRIAHMACHFSSTGPGLADLPDAIPEKSVLLLNDRFPFQDRDPLPIRDTLLTFCRQHSPRAVLLDFERPYDPSLSQLAGILQQSLPCPVPVCPVYGKELSGPVFLPAPPLSVPLDKYLIPWKERQIWLEAAPDSQVLTLDSRGCTAAAGEARTLTGPHIFPCKELFCSYRVEICGDHAIFTLSRDLLQLEAFLEYARSLGVWAAVGLYQQISPMFLQSASEQEG